MTLEAGTLLALVVAVVSATVWIVRSNAKVATAAQNAANEIKAAKITMHGFDERLAEALRRWDRTESRVRRLELDFVEVRTILKLKRGGPEENGGAP